MQTAMSFVEDYPTKMAERKLLDAIRQCVANISLKELAYRLNIQPSLLADAMAERANKGVRASWLVSIVKEAPINDVISLLNELASLRGLEVVPRKELTAEERAERLEEKLRSLGATGLRLIEEAIGGPR